MQYKSATDIADALDGKRSGNGYVAHCPAHNDQKTPNLSITDGDNGKVLVKCFAGCSQESVIEALKDRGLWPKGNGKYVPPLNARNSATPTGVTLEEYAAAKVLEVEFLKSCELSEVTYGGNTALRIPYLDENGQTPAVRIRRDLHKGEGTDMRFVWRKGSRLCLYGLWRLNRDVDFVFLVEGESDCHTLWHHNINALGIPGATNWREDRDAQHISDFKRIYVVVEPDAGGEAVLKWVEHSAIQGRVVLVHVPGGDISQLHVNNPDNFKAQLRTALESAQTWTDYHAEQQNETRTEAWENSKELAESQNILDVFETDLHELAVVGERRTAKILYLAMTSRLLARPVSVAVKGPSSGGKSYLVEQVLKFFPEESYYALSAMSEHALAYSLEPLKHRFLVIYEAAGMTGDIATYLIRSLLSEGCVKYETVEKTTEGLQARLIEREGPTGLLVTTTEIKLHPENETRLLSITVTDTPAHTADILLELARDVSGAVDFERWHALQTWLNTAEHRVYIPYALKLAKMIPPIAVRLRRDFTAILNLVKAHAILHRATRERDDQGRIVATLDDYSVVRDLVADLVAEGVEATVPDTVRETVAAVEALNPVADGVSITEIAKHLKLDKSAAYRRIRTATNRGYLRNLESKRGRTAKLVTADPLPEEVKILPTVAGLQGCSSKTGDTPPSPPEPGLQGCTHNQGDTPPPTKQEGCRVAVAKERVHAPPVKLVQVMCKDCDNWVIGQCSVGMSVSDPAISRHCGRFIKEGGHPITPPNTAATLQPYPEYVPGADL